MKIQHNQLKKIFDKELRHFTYWITGLLQKDGTQKQSEGGDAQGKVPGRVGEFQTHHPPSASTVHGPGSSLNPIFFGVLVKAFGVLGGGFITRDVTD